MILHASLIYVAAGFNSFAFGASTPAQPAFGATQQTGFGAPQQQPGFGATQQQSGFGATQQQSGFGATQQQPGFGATQQQSAFGAPQQQNAAFGQTPAFGSTGKCLRHPLCLWLEL